MPGIECNELRYHVIRPTLGAINLWSEAAENLLLATCAHESLLGYFLKQREGLALGIYQIEPTTHQCVWQNYLNYRPALAAKINATTKDNRRQPQDCELITNLAYATAIARIIYYRASAPLPPADNIKKQAIYWKRYYNTADGEGKITDFIQHAKEIIV